MMDDMNHPLITSPTSFDLLVPPRVVFGWGRRREIGPLAASLGRRAFFICGSTLLQANGTIADLVHLISAANVQPVMLAHVSREPLVKDVDQVTRQLLKHQPAQGDVVIAIGGGSAMDLGKAVAAMVTNREGTSVADYLEGVGQGLKITKPLLPVLAVPTTAGTGSEATKNSVISSVVPPFKKSLRSCAMIPQIVLIDPELTISVPPQTTAYTGMDAITQLIESYISCRATSFTRTICLEGLRYALPAIETAVQNGTSRPAREAMAYAAYLSGVALANSGLGLAHGVAAALGVQANVPHGLACAVMLPPTLRANRACCTREFATMLTCWKATEQNNMPAALPTHDIEKSADDFVERIDQLVTALAIPQRLSQIGVQREQLSALVSGSHGNSRTGNPFLITDEQVASLLDQIF